VLATHYKTCLGVFVTISTHTLAKKMKKTAKNSQNGQKTIILAVSEGAAYVYF